jgi:hypothetical protein
VGVSMVLESRSQEGEGGRVVELEVELEGMRVMEG